jgi:HEAT repeat protein
MASRPASRDYHGWVAQLGKHSRCRQARLHLLAAGQEALPAIKRGLGHREPMVRRQCVNLLDHLLDEGAVQALVEAIDDPDDQVAARALHALACDRCKQGECRPGEDLWVPRALELLSSARTDLRAGAIDALGKVASRRPEVAAALAHSAAEDPDKGLRGQARHFVPTSMA